MTVVGVVVGLIAGVVSQYLAWSVEMYMYPHRTCFMSGNNNIILFTQLQLHQQYITGNSTRLRYIVYTYFILFYYKKERFVGSSEGIDQILLTYLQRLQMNYCYYIF